MSFDEDKLQSEDEQWVMYRLVKAVSAPGMRRNMQVEDEILSAIEKRDTEIMRKEQELEQSRQELQQSKQELQQSKQELQQSKQVIEQKDQVIEQSRQELEQKERMLRSAVVMLREQGLSAVNIAGCLGLTEEEVGRILAEEMTRRADGTRQAD